MNTKSPTVKEMYFSELLGIQVIGFLLIFPTSVWSDEVHSLASYAAQQGYD